MAQNLSLHKAFDIIEFLSDKKVKVGVTDIASNLNLNKTTVHRILNTLISRNYIEKNAEGKYALGPKFIELSSVYLSKVELKTEAKPFLTKLANETKLTLHLAILDDLEAVYIDKVESNSDLRLYSQIGKRIPVYCSAIGKILISKYDEYFLEGYVKKIKFEKFTENTIDRWEELLKEIKKVKKEGVAYDIQEHEEGICCIAKPIYDYTNNIIAAISITGNAKVVQNNKELEKSVEKTALNISERLGYGGNK